MVRNFCCMETIKPDAPGVVQCQECQERHIAYEFMGEYILSKFIPYNRAKKFIKILKSLGFKKTGGHYRLSVGCSGRKGYVLIHPLEMELREDPTKHVITRVAEMRRRLENDSNWVAEGLLLSADPRLRKKGEELSRGGDH